VDTVLDAVLDDRAPRLVASAVSVPGPARAERRWLTRRGGAGPTAVLAEIGEALACGPLIGLARARALGLAEPCLLSATWLGDYGAILWPF
jgi:hypothetical protein